MSTAILLKTECSTAFSGFSGKMKICLHGFAVKDMLQPVSIIPPHRYKQCKCIVTVQRD